MCPLVGGALSHRVPGGHTALRAFGIEWNGGAGRFFPEAAAIGACAAVPVMAPKSVIRRTHRATHVHILIASDFVLATVRFLFSPQNGCWWQRSCPELLCKCEAQYNVPVGKRLMQATHAVWRTERTIEHLTKKKE